MSHQDDVFVGTFKGVMIFLIAFAIVIYIVAKLLTSGFYEQGAAEAPVDTVVEENIAPVGKVRLTDASGAAPAAAPAAQQMSGDQVYTTACAACHATGAAGAPKLGDAAAWGPRIARGMDTLVDHAINGFKGMPAKGGRGDLSDDAVRAAVEHIVANSK